VWNTEPGKQGRRLFLSFKVLAEQTWLTWLTRTLHPNCKEILVGKVKTVTSPPIETPKFACKHNNKIDLKEVGF
jgi:hypothetical protein